ncbi:hypothetical protein ACTJIJ_02075 [Niabella sp. 22666]|uniref:hypothetical protein n=1 Tax=Niabella sp. 22666 TaxID=3453954 RepID=UPI003F86D6C7
MITVEASPSFSLQEVKRREKANSMKSPHKKDTRDKKINQRISEFIRQIYYYF